MTTAYHVKKRVRDPRTGREGRVVFVSPVTKQIYVEYGRTSESWVAYNPSELGDLFSNIELTRDS